MANAFGKAHLSEIGNKARYRNPDAIQQPSKKIARLIPEFQKISGARRMAQHLSRDGNRSRSFQVLMEGIEYLISDMPKTASIEETKRNG
jgi:hypothetical protein